MCTYIKLPPYDRSHCITVRMVVVRLYYTVVTREFSARLFSRERYEDVSEYASMYDTRLDINYSMNAKEDICVALSLLYFYTRYIDRI